MPAETFKKKVEDFDDYIIRRERQILQNDYVPMIRDMILKQYDDDLVGVVTDRRSKTNPMFYRDDFKDALEDFEYVKPGDLRTTLVIPDMDNFPFSKGKLTIIKTILTGVIGTFAEVTADQYSALFGKIPIKEEPYDNTVPTKERIYLVRYTTELQQREYKVFKGPTLVRYPFSNMPPIRIFDPVNKFVEDSFESWVSEIVNRTIKEYAKKEQVADEL
jgi:hypothetical protein